MLKGYIIYIYATTSKSPQATTADKKGGHSQILIIEVFHLLELDIQNG